MAEKSSKRVPPLAYIIGALLVVMAVLAVVQWRGTYQPPSGGPVIGQSQTMGGDAVPQAPYVPGPTAPPAPTGSGPNNLPGVQTGPAPQGRPS